ncbi:HPr family phosphocarrier protein [Streptomyces sp. NPDC035033]|uniref:HPr family phosphocarrier protein n=1 Tax=Streptomyces sp. NPDC035033 TaxID=3155368 RepID=UPI0033FD9F8D
MSASSEAGRPEARAETPSGVRLSVVLPADLHARPAGAVARRAAGLPGGVYVEAAGRSADAASVLALMALGARAGETVHVRAEGAGAEAAAAAVAELLAAAE